MNTLEKLRARAKSTLDAQADHESIIERKDKYRRNFASITDVQILAVEQAKAQDEKERLEGLLKEANAAFDVIRLELLPTLMEDRGIEKVTYEGLGRVQLAADLYVSTKKGEKDGLFKWLKARKLGSLIQPGVNSSTLKAFIKERIEKGKEIPSDYLNVTPFTRASIVGRD